MTQTVLVSGDWHGHDSWLKVVFREAVRARASAILQVGDFGVWPKLDPKGDFAVPEQGHAAFSPDPFLDLVRSWSVANDLPVIFVEGNHDWHPWLRRQAEDPGNVTDEGLVKAAGRTVLWAPRGSRFELAGTRFLALGGAYSVDKKYRTEGLSWWPEETITDEDVERAVAGGETDVLLSHDVPTGVDPFGPDTAGNKDAFPESLDNRRRLRRVAEGVRPKLVLHGHYHNRYSGGFRLEDGHEVEVEGLDKNGTMQKNWMLLDLPSLERWPRYRR